MLAAISNGFIKLSQGWFPGINVGTQTETIPRTLLKLTLTHCSAAGGRCPGFVHALFIPELS